MSATADGRGLFLVVGPSGAGKDSLLNCARTRLAGDPDVVFPKRFITRPADAGGEDHEAISDAVFAKHKTCGRFALDWSAHGLCYAVPAGIADDLRAGKRVIVNVSRAILDDARTRFPGLTVLSVTASAATLTSRLHARGREDAADIRARIARAESMKPAGPDVIEIANDGALEDAAARFVAAIYAACHEARPVAVIR